MSEMASEYQIRPITVDEYHRMGEAGILGPEERVELLDGELIAMAPIGPSHGFGTRELNEIFVTRFAGRAIIDTGNPVILDDYSEPQPDLMLLAPSSTRYRFATPRANDVLLLVEVSDSSLRLDRGRKLRAYARVGIVEVWIVNVPEERVERYADLAHGTYATVETFGRGSRLAPRAFPNDAIDVDAFLP